MTGDPAEEFPALAARHERCFWLDGGGSREWSGRRSLVGRLEDEDVSLSYDASTRTVTRWCKGRGEHVGDDIFTVLAAETARDGGDPSVSWVGWFGYAARPDLPARVAPPAAPGRVRPCDAVWMRCTNTRVFDHPAPADLRIPQPEPRAEQGVPAWAEYAGWFDEVQRQLRLGNSYEVNLTYRQSVASAQDPVASYLRLREANPAPYAAYLQHHGTHVLSSSPERFATITRDRWLETKPIKGTTPRGATADEDERLRTSLATDPRYRAENLMIVDLLRNDLSTVCEPGTVTVPSLMTVESYQTVHQLVSTVRGRLRSGVTTLEALRALFPAGSMTGAPKLRTMQIIADVETTPRGIYAGALGWISGDGRSDLGVVIRTLVATPDPGGRGWRYELGTGGGITVQSEPRSEFDETRWKAQRVLSVLPP